MVQSKPAKRSQFWCSRLAGGSGAMVVQTSLILAMLLGLCHSQDCHNNTQGAECSECKPFFVGDVSNDTQCIPCKEFCNGHSDICFSKDVLTILNSGNITSKVTNETLVNVNTIMIDTKDLESKPGPLPSQAICLNCKHNTQGDRCDTCAPGFFKTSQSIRDGCIPCHCHGHGDHCDPQTGEECNCANNTETPNECRRFVKEPPTPCWSLQCARCKEYFLGNPTHGHQCYRHLFLDKDYCFDPETYDECELDSSPLVRGKAVFFAIQPRYMNVDLRILVDVTNGSVDLYLASKEDAFIVEVNRSNSHHDIWLDNKYELNGDEIMNGMLLLKSGSPSSPRNYEDDDDDDDEDYGTLMKYRGIDSVVVKSRKAESFVTHVTLEESNELLMVQGLKNRLVITIPQELHDLRSKRFYLVLKGSSDSDSSCGNLFVRQDQSRIDLFVFFSVFFSCFFLFLASCVVFWKIKQALDLRAARRLHVAEMKHLASRPFASIPVLVHPLAEDADRFEFALQSPLHANTKKQTFKLLKVKDLKLESSPKHLDIGDTAMETHEKCHLIRPVAVEPIADGNAAVVTTVIILPGGISAPVRMTLASSLVNLKSSVQNLLQFTSNNGNGATNASRIRDPHKVHPSNIRVVRRRVYY